MTDDERAFLHALARFYLTNRAERDEPTYALDAVHVHDDLSRYARAIVDEGT